MEGRGWRLFKENRNKKTDRQWLETVGSGRRSEWTASCTSVDEGLSGRRAARQRIVALEKTEQKEKNNSIHSVMMAFVDIAVLRFNSVNSYR
jgi:hypothetical protein